MTKIDDVLYQIMWNRLIAVVEEQAQALIRTAFSTSVREAGDVSAGVFDRHGRMIAQAVTGTPGHVNAMAEAAQHIIHDIGPDNIRAGDVYITNDPWKGTGHLHDITLLTPSFYKDRLVGFFAATAHVIDIGGRGFGPDARQLYEEGLFIPIMKLMDRGKINDVLINIVRANVREQRQVVGDILSLVVCNETGHKRLCDMLEEFAIDDLDALANFIFSRSREATMQAINALPRGTSENHMSIDGYDRQVELHVKLTIEHDRVLADLAGSSGVSSYGINVPMIYTRAYACYGLKCAIAPQIPNNYASLSPFEVVAPERTIVNALRPSPVAARHVIGHMIPDLVLGALHEILPGQIPAESAGALWNIQISAEEIHPDSTSAGPRQVLMFNSGGTGARATLDGLSATAFPSGVNTMSVEVTEQSGPIVVWRKELLPNSGGAGRQRGGLGQRIVIGAAEGYALHFNAMFDRVNNPARGRDGGLAGQAGAVRLDDGTVLKGKGRQAVPADARVVFDLPGGGGFGDPSQRPREALRNDLAAGYLTEDHARRFYGHAD